MRLQLSDVADAVSTDNAITAECDCSDKCVERLLDGMSAAQAQVNYESMHLVNIVSSV